MSIAAEHLIAARRRVNSIPGLKDHIYTPADPFKARAVRQLCKAFVSEIRVEGEENLAKAAELPQTETVSVISNHRSNADTGILKHIAEVTGYWSFADRWVFMMGIKMREDPFTSQVFTFTKTLLTIPPADLELTRDMIRDPGKYGLRPEDLTILEKYKNLCNEVVMLSTRKNKFLQSQGMVTVVYPEATRSRDGFLGPAPRTLSLYFLDPAWVLPVSLEGSDYIYPVKSPIPHRRGPVTLRVGELFRTEEIKNRWTESKRNNNPYTLADFALARIARLNLNLVRPDERDWYAAIEIQTDP